MIKERHGALARNKPASKKVANRMSYVGGVRESRRGWRNWKHMGALAFPFFPVFLLFLPSFLPLFRRYAVVSASGIEIFT